MDFLDVIFYSGLLVMIGWGIKVLLPIVWKGEEEGAGVQLTTNRGYPIIIDTRLPGTYAEVRKTTNLENGTVEYDLYNPQKGFFLKRYMEGELVPTLGTMDAIGYGQEVFVPIDGVFPSGEQAEMLRRVKNQAYQYLQSRNLYKQELALLKANKDEVVGSEIKRATEMMGSQKHVGFKK